MSGSRRITSNNTIGEMDKHGVERAMLGFSFDTDLMLDAVKRHPGRFMLSYEANPNEGMDEVRKIERLYKEHDIKAVTAFPAGLCPQVPVNDKKWYPIYGKLVELGIPFCPCMGVPGPRIPMIPQHVELLDEICWFFPELTIITRHGCDPWTDLAIKLMLKYPEFALYDQRLGAEALSEGDHRLRQHAWRRQDSLCRLLPYGTFAGAHLQRDAGSSVSR